MAATKPRSVRVPDALWEAAGAEAAANYETISDVVVRALVAYTAGRREAAVADWEAVSAAASAASDRELGAAIATVLGLKREPKKPR